MKKLAAALSVVLISAIQGCGPQGHPAAPAPGPAAAQISLVLDKGAIAPEQGQAYTYPTPQFADRSDDGKNPNRSGLVLLEDGKPLGPAHSVHQDIRDKGQGRWSHWGGFVYFSSSDGSDPRRNQKKYELGSAAQP